MDAQNCDSFTTVHFGNVEHKVQCFARENETEQLKKRKEAAVMQVQLSFAQTGDIIDEFQYIFAEGEEGISSKSLQYILKWLDKVRLAQKETGDKDGTEHQRGRGNTPWTLACGSNRVAQRGEAN